MTNGMSSLDEIEQRWPRVPVTGKTEPFEDGEAALESAIARLGARSEELRATLRELEEPQPRSLTLVPAVAVPAPGEQDEGVAESTVPARLEKANGHSSGRQLRRSDPDGARIGALTSSAAALTEREQALAKREAELARVEELVESRAEHLEHRANVLAADEQDLQERVCQLDEREVALDERDARASADLELRLDRIEEQESELRTLAEHLDERDRDLRAYVAAVQRMMSQGTDPSASAFGRGALRP